MVISRTPFRISFFGGGTDYPAWYRENPGAVLATTFNKYCYISCRYLPPFFEYRSRVLYSRVEHVNRLDEIQHPAVREALRFLGIERGIEIHHDGDLPARTGLGSSSTFTVGLLHALHALQGRMPSKMDLALGAIHIEQEMIKETVGAQDQVIAAFGGFNRIDFLPDRPIQVSPITIRPIRFRELEERLMLFFTGFTRTASEIAAEQVARIPERRSELRAMYQMVDEAIRILQDGKGIDDIGRLLHEAWRVKRGLSQRVSTARIDEIYETARRAGAIGGKILGAGGGGFMLIFASPEAQPRVREALRDLLLIPFKFEHTGSHIIFFDRDTEHG